MSISPRHLLSALFALVLSLPASAEFEGKVYFDMTAGRETQPVVYSLKGDNARFEMLNMPGGMGTMIIDGKKQEGYALMPEQKMYMSISLATAVDAANKQATDVKFEDTGETEEILGRKCRKFRVTDRDTTTEIWAAQGMGKFAAQMGGNPLRGSKNSLPSWQREMFAKGYFPLRTVGLNKRGKETFRMQATKIEETSLADSLFQVPAGYQQFSMGGLMQGLIPGSK
jgi:hypothetical protein